MTAREPSAVDPFTHLSKAKGLLDNAWANMRGGDGPLLHTHEVRADLIATAHVHAILALVEAVRGE